MTEMTEMSEMSEMSDPTISPQRRRSTSISEGVAITSPVVGSRRRSSSFTEMRRTPRSAVRALAQIPVPSLSYPEWIEMTRYDPDRQMFEPPGDPMATFYRKESVMSGEGGYSQNVAQDLEILKTQGFIIDMKNGFLGNGFYGEVYRGVYGENAKNLVDKNGEPLRNVSPGQPFAAKLVDFQKEEKDYKVAHFVGQTLEKRESYEIEKLVFDRADHKNITPIRMSINMGESRIFNYQKSRKQYVQHDRVYLVMDLAQFGSLLNYLKDYDLQPTDRIKLVRDCFQGLKYLHDMNIAHGDIHTGNVLIFKEDEDVVAKWTDFGLAFVTSKGEYIYNTHRTQLKRMFAKKVSVDCERFANVIWNIWRDRKRDTETQDIQQLCDRHMQLIDIMRRAKDLDEVLNQCPDILSYQERMI